MELRVANTYELHEAVAQCNKSKAKEVVIYLDAGVYNALGTPTEPGLIISRSNVKLIGLGNNRDEVVIYDNRGHMINAYPADKGANTNAQTISFVGDNIYLENLTIGNYCNIDFAYKYNNRFNQKKYSDIVTQAYAIAGVGKNYVFKNVSIIGLMDTMNLMVVGVHIIDSFLMGSIDFITGRGKVIIENCKIRILGPCPISKSDELMLFKDCELYIDYKDMTVLNLTKGKGGGNVVLFNCHFFGNVSKIEWSTESAYEDKFYYHNVFLNERPILVGSNECNRVEFVDNGFNFNTTKIMNNEIDYQMTFNKNHISLEYGEKTVIETNLHNSTLMVAGKLNCTVNGDKITIENVNDNLTNETYYVEVANGYLKGTIVVKAFCKKVKQPEFLTAPTIYLDKFELKLNYSFDGKDDSTILWYRNDVCILNSDNEIASSYPLSMADNGAIIKAVIYPRNPNSLCVEFKELVYKNELVLKSYEIKDFKRYYLQHTTFTPNVLMFSTYHPSYIGVEVPNVADWETGNKEEAFIYGKGRDAAQQTYGLITNARGAMMAFEPSDRYFDMSISIDLGSEKFSGKGFGSGNGQYGEIFISYDHRTESGYALRMEREPSSANDVYFSLREYKKGKNTLLTEKIASCAYLNPTHIELSLINGVLNASAKTLSEVPVECRTTNSVSFQIKVRPIGSGFKFQHTGTVHLGNRTIVKSLKITY